MNVLNPLTLPLNQISLIEASAGTGKTYTMTSLYLRLLLQAGENNFSEALNVEQILVVTFTEAATQELKERILERIHQAKKAFQAWLQGDDSQLKQDAFLFELAQSIQDLPLAIQRLNLAEQNLDLASIYTIHGFCRRMLVQYAFNSGIHFNLELSKDDKPLLDRLIKEYWRAQFYSLSLPQAYFVKQHLGSPQQVLKSLGNYMRTGMPQPNLADKNLLNLSFSELFASLAEMEQQIQQFKQQWLAQEGDIRQYLASINDQVKGFGAKSTNTRFEKVSAWANSTEMEVHDVLLKYFNHQHFLTNNKSGEEIQAHPIFLASDELCQLQQKLALYPSLFKYRYIQEVRANFLGYKANQAQKNFDDLLRLLKDALYSAQGDQLAGFIGYQYPFAMIDEFQDTDAQQYDIFAKIYIQNPQPERGFIMIGDPKQAIYQFRGADIFTYLTASKQAQQRFSLDTNYRSEKTLVASVNQLFNFPNAPFLFEDIQFSPVKAKKQGKFVLNGQEQKGIQVFLHSEFKDPQLAQNCAQSIQQWLKSAEQKNAFFQGEANNEQERINQPLENQEIAVIVRNKFEAEQVKQALAKLGIASVYLSEANNVFDTAEARELAIILRACLNPLNERNISNAISTAIFALNASEIQQIKQNEMSWELWVERFVDYQKCWQQQGILAMLHRLFLQENIASKQFAMAQGERRITDLLHLAELLQQATLLNESESALLRWFELQLQQHSGGDEQQARLESEQKLVKIVTIHKSKGLQYGLVWLPFIGKEAKASKGMDFYHDEQDQTQYWDMQGQFSAMVEQERLAEEMRLLYVALTRAKYQICLALPTEFEKKWNAFLYLITKGEVGKSLSYKGKYDTQSLLSAFPEIDVLPYEVSEDPWRPIQGEALQLEAQHFQGKIEQHWQLNSFTSLAYMHQRLLEKRQRQQGKKPYFSQAEQSAPDFAQVLDPAKDYDLQFEPLPEDLQTPAISAELAQVASSFPHGMNVGSYFHRYFEDHSFQQVNSEGVQKLCQSLQLDSSWLEPTSQWIEGILRNPLLPDSDLCLAKIDNQHCLKELQFFLKLGANFELNQFNQLLAQHHVLPREFLFEQIEGMVRGFMDLVFVYQGKYYVLDYKTNLLGNQLNAYAQPALAKAMQGADYDLQYLIYCLALHRYLRQRLPDYDYARDFGGAIYCFVRGMNGESADYGVYMDKPKPELMAGLDLLFADKKL